MEKKEKELIKELLASGKLKEKSFIKFAIEELLKCVCSTEEEQEKE